MVKSMYKKGMTLIELILYIGLFTLLVLLVFSTTFYMQKILQDNMGEYAVRRDVYIHIHVLQGYILSAERVETDGTKLNLFMKNNSLVKITQTLEGGKIQLEYIYSDSSKNKQFSVFDEYVFERIEFECPSPRISTMYTQTLCKIAIHWKNNRKQERSITEFLTIPNHQ